MKASSTTLNESHYETVKTVKTYNLRLATNLVLIEFTVLILLFTFFLECNDDKADEDVDHEESDDDDVDKEKYGYQWP